MSDVFRADYQALEQIAQRFTAQAETLTEMQQQVIRTERKLQGGSWIGRGSNSFVEEMEGEVLPALQRLIDALEEAGRITKAVADIIRQAEEEAAEPFHEEAQQGGGGGGGEEAQEESGGAGSGAGSSGGGDSGEGTPAETPESIGAMSPGSGGGGFPDGGWSVDPFGRGLDLDRGGATTGQEATASQAPLRFQPAGGIGARFGGQAPERDYVQVPAGAPGASEVVAAGGWSAVLLAASPLAALLGKALRDRDDDS